MGAGKSTIGKMLASRLSSSFYDTDSLIEEKSGADIPWIFDVEGEAGFRQREVNVLAELLDNPASVISTGGGIIVSDANVRKLSELDGVIYLTANIQQLVERTHKDKKRPLLQVEDPRAKIVELFEQRDPIYRQVANHVIETDSRPPKHVVQRIIDKIGAAT